MIIEDTLVHKLSNIYLEHLQHNVYKIMLKQCIFIAKTMYSRYYTSWHITTSTFFIFMGLPMAAAWTGHILTWVTFLGNLGLSFLRTQHDLTNSVPSSSFPCKYWTYDLYDLQKRQQLIKQHTMLYFKALFILSFYTCDFLYMVIYLDKHNKITMDPSQY